MIDDDSPQLQGSIPDLVSGLTVYEYLVFETMFEMFADLREVAAYSRAQIPSLDIVFDRSRKMAVPRKQRKEERLDKQIVVAKFREVLRSHGIPEAKPNKYVYRKRLREMGSDLFLYVRENRSAVQLLQTTN